MNRSPSEAFLYICKLCKGSNQGRTTGKHSINDSTLLEIKAVMTCLEKRVRGQEENSVSSVNRVMEAHTSTHLEMRAMVKSLNNLIEVQEESIASLEKRIVEAQSSSIAEVMRFTKQVVTNSPATCSIANSYPNISSDLANLGASSPEPGSSQTKTYSSVVNQQSRSARINSPPGHPGTKPHNSRVDFDPSKCVVVHSFVNKRLALNYGAIRHNISNLLDNPAIVFLKKFEHGKNDPQTDDTVCAIFISRHTT